MAKKLKHCRISRLPLSSELLADPASSLVSSGSSDSSAVTHQHLLPDSESDIASHSPPTPSPSTLPILSFLESALFHAQRSSSPAATNPTHSHSTSALQVPASLPACATAFNSARVVESGALYPPKWYDKNSAPGHSPKLSLLAFASNTWATISCFCTLCSSQIFPKQHPLFRWIPLLITLAGSLCAAVAAFHLSKFACAAGMISAIGTFGKDINSILSGKENKPKEDPPNLEVSSTIARITSDKVIALAVRKRRSPKIFCEVCSAGFTAKHNFENHMHSHNSIKPYSCEVSGESFKAPLAKERHLKNQKAS
ncbi:hypothetical protein GYMLUDRAFT_46695 [Collybiopsis luxurians FD-317 M1]|uniref:C2H2-type domain-containing protein n=1 Tax=Collybiopsis luxurians FD-317 M1 TaxID=944289 RepID=A0A0D0BPS8_9AGAR|nr:hypothetical protein GYMLUDRAFT_46695 [Collybiopsis luxurians FD-317 M1]